MTDKQRLIFSIAVLIPLLAFAGFWMGTREESVACTLEAMVCPDGTAVGRTGPMCEFEKCPQMDPPL